MITKGRRAIAGDLALYALSAAFAGVTAATSTLVPHRAWGAVAVVGYTIAAGSAVVLLFSRYADSLPARTVVSAFAWASTALLPMVIQAAQRAGGRTDRAQEEVVVIEHGGQRLLDHGTPYLRTDEIAALPSGEQLLGYLPYQPGMALFGLPRALAGVAWWTDARIWFALVTAVVLGFAATLLVRGNALLRAMQFATVLPVCALTLATGGDDIPVLALCLCALALCAAARYGAAGVAVGVAAALKLFAWPVALVLLVHALWGGARTGGGARVAAPSPAPHSDLVGPWSGRWAGSPGAAGTAAWPRWPEGLRLAIGAITLPILALIPAAVIDSTALLDNVVRFPLGEGVVESPAQSPFPGYLIANNLPGGRVIAGALLVAAGLAIAVWMIRRPPSTAADAAKVCGIGLLAAILLMPSTRFGYLLYPVAFLMWVPALRRPA